MPFSKLEKMLFGLLTKKKDTKRVISDSIASTNASSIISEGSFVNKLNKGSLNESLITKENSSIIS